MLLAAICGAVMAEPSDVEITSRAGDAIPVQVYPAVGEKLVLWLPAEYGTSPRQLPTAQRLAELGIEVWLPDLHTAWFLPTGRYSLVGVEPFIVADLITAAITKTGKQVLLLAQGRTAALALTGIHAWRQDAPDADGVGGAVLLHPQLFRRTPQGGESAQYLPIVNAARLPLYLLQPEQAATFWRVGHLAETLEEHGSKVFLQRLPNVGNGFNIRPDFEPAEAALTARLPDIIQRAITQLQGTLVDSGTSLFMAEALEPPERPTRTDLLKPYPQPRSAPALELTDVDGRSHSLAEHKGRVVVVNFWATWCPPCVEELPSLQRLQDRLEADGMDILTVAVGEAADKVRRFLADKGTRFPVLLDTDGRAFKQWQAYAFPTTLILDREHQIRYAVYGALTWDSPDIVATLQTLLLGESNQPRVNERSVTETAE